MDYTVIINYSKQSLGAMSKDRKNIIKSMCSYAGSRTLISQTTDCYANKPAKELSRWPMSSASSRPWSLLSRGHGLHCSIMQQHHTKNVKIYLDVNRSWQKHYEYLWVLIITINMKCYKQIITHYKYVYNLLEAWASWSVLVLDQVSAVQVFCHHSVTKGHKLDF